jgi:polar amino acid transport system ATP-binding protein
MPVVRLSEVRKDYGTLAVLKDISLVVESGEVVCLIGRSGSGKSTLLRCINGLEGINGGTIEVQDKQIPRKESELRLLRRHVGMVFQSYNLFPHITAERNVMLALRVVKKMPVRAAREIALASLAQVGLADKKDAYPEQLSGGQQQRVAIARCLAMQPSIMLFDEVASALDPELKDEVLKVMERLAADGMTMVLVTHEMMFARRVANRVVFMHDGRVWEQGPPAKIFRDPQTPELKQFLSSVTNDHPNDTTLGALAAANGAVDRSAATTLGGTE